MTGLHGCMQPPHSWRAPCSFNCFHLTEKELAATIPNAFPRVDDIQVVHPFYSTFMTRRHKKKSSQSTTLDAATLTKHPAPPCVAKAAWDVADGYHLGACARLGGEQEWRLHWRGAASRKKEMAERKEAWRDNHGVFLFVPGPPSVQDLKRQFFVAQNFNPRKSFFFTEEW